MDRLRWIGKTVRRTLFVVGSFVACTTCLPAASQQPSKLEFRIPPIRIPFNIKDQRVAVIASGSINTISSSHDVTTFRLDLNTDLSDLQQHATALLGAQLDKDDHCGEHIEIQQATLAPIAPASIATVQLNYERRACVKVLGKRESKRLVGGKARVRIKLTPAVENNNTELKLVPEVQAIEADGSLGELLRSGPLGEMIREKIRAAILSALEKGTDLRAVIPPVAQPYAKIQSAQFRDAGSGRLMVALEGEIRITRDQVQELSRELKERSRNLAHPAN